MGYRCFGASLPMRICIMVRIRQDPPHTRMWRDDLKITANRSGLHLVSYTEASHQTGRRLPLARSIGVAPSDGLPPPPYERIEKRFAQIVCRQTTPPPPDALWHGALSLGTRF